MTAAAHPSQTLRPSPLRRLLWPVVAVLLVIGSLVAWNNGIRNRFFPKAFRVVEPGQIYASGQIYRGLVAQTISRYQIKRLIALNDDKADPDAQAERQIAEQMGVEYFVFPLNGDGTGDIHNYEKTLIQVHRAEADGAPILVHCFAGAQRTRIWIAYYRLLIQRRPPAAVAAELTNSTWRGEPNAHLFPFINQNMAAMAQLLAADGLIDRVPDPLPLLPQ